MAPPPFGLVSISIHITGLPVYNVIANQPTPGVPLIVASFDSQSVAAISGKWDLQKSGSTYSLIAMGSYPVIFTPGEIAALGSFGGAPTPLSIIEVAPGKYRISVAGTGYTVKLDGDSRYAPGSTISTKENMNYADMTTIFSITPTS